MANYSHWEIQHDTHERCTHDGFDEFVAGQHGFPFQPARWPDTTERDVLKAYTAWLQESVALLNADDKKDGKYLQQLLSSAMADDQAMAFHEEVELITDRMKERKHLRQVISTLETNLAVLPPRPNCLIDTVSLETPVMTGRDFKLGNVDVLVAYREPQLIAPEILLPLFPKEVDISTPMLFEVVWSNLCYAEFECKSAIHDPGELFRQLYDHRRGLPTPLKQFVVSPDTRYRDLIRQQGFGFVLYVPLELEEASSSPQMDFNFHDL